jgi:sortase A
VLLKVGTAMILFSVALAATVATVVALSGSSGEEEVASPVASVESPETTARENAFDPGKKLEIDDESSEEVETLPVPPENWPKPSREQVAATQVPRYYQPQQDAQLSLTVEDIGLYDVPVINSNTKEALDRGVIHHPQTPMPWEQRQQKNVYLAGHRLGWPGTGSHLVFYNLDKLSKNDPVFLTDGLGNAYEYRVSEVFVVGPNADWVIDPVRNRDMVTLQTCTYPDLVNRIVVRADRVYS